jgi:Iap family predicted aminopeptidase
MKKAVLLAVALLLLALAGPATALAAPTFDQAMDQLVTQGYPQSIETSLNSLGTTPLGFRWAGSASDNAAAAYLASQMRAIGLKNVRLEAVPLDVFEPRGASVSAGGSTWVASQFAGVPGTSVKGITSQVVYVGGGTKADYEGKDVRGKIVLIDLMLNSWWLHTPAHEATLHGAKAIIYTVDPAIDDSYYTIAPDALGSNDGLYGRGWVPAVYISIQDGFALKSQLLSGPVSATVKSDVKIRYEQNGGVGYDVIGELPGTAHNGQMVVVSGHHDAHFRPGFDDTSGVTQAMTIAKAMVMSNYRPQRSVVFMLTTAEEFGYTDTDYDFLVGSWWPITHTHADWPGKVAAQINLEAQGGTGSPIGLTIAAELNPWGKALALANPALNPWGTRVSTPVSTWTDSFPFLTNGIPSMTFSDSGSNYTGRYHTTYDVQSLIDWDYFGDMGKLEFLFAQGLDTGLLPYSLQYQADRMVSRGEVDEAELLDAGADPAVVARLVDEVAAYQAAASAFDADSSSIPATQLPAVNKALLGIEKLLDSRLIAMAPDGATVTYLHQQDLWDVQGIDAALAALPADPAGALDALTGVYQMWLTLFFSDPVYYTECLWQTPGYPRLGYGASAHLVTPVDVLPEYRLIEAGRYGAAAKGLDCKLARRLAELNGRLCTMSAVLDTAAARIQALP